MIDATFCIFSRVPVFVVYPAKGKEARYVLPQGALQDVHSVPAAAETCAHNVRILKIGGKSIVFVQA